MTAYTAIAMRAHLGTTLLRHMLATLRETGHHPSTNQPPGVRSTATAGFVAFATAGGLTAHLEPCSTVAPGIFATASMGCVTSLCNLKPASPHGLAQNTAVAAAPLLLAEPRHRSLQGHRIPRLATNQRFEGQGMHTCCSPQEWPNVEVREHSHDMWPLWQILAMP